MFYSTQISVILAQWLGIAKACMYYVTCILLYCIPLKSLSVTSENIFVYIYGVLQVLVFPVRF